MSIFGIAGLAPVNFTLPLIVPPPWAAGTPGRTHPASASTSTAPPAPATTPGSPTLPPRGKPRGLSLSPRTPRPAPLGPPHHHESQPQRHEHGQHRRNEHARRRGPIERQEVPGAHGRARAVFPAGAR